MCVRMLIRRIFKYMSFAKFRGFYAILSKAFAQKSGNQVVFAQNERFDIEQAMLFAQNNLLFADY